MKILIVNYEFPPIGGGGGRISYEIAKHLRGKLDISILTCYYPQKRIYPEKIEDVKIYSVPSFRQSVHYSGISGVLSFLIFAFFKFRKIIRENKFDVIHYFFSIPTGLLSFFQPKKIPYLVSLNGIDVPGYSPKEMALLREMVMPINRRILNSAVAVTAVSRNLADFAKQKLKIKPCKIIFNGIDFANFNRGEDNNKKNQGKNKEMKIICVSRLLYFKRIDLLLQAIKDVSGVRLEIIGEGSHREKLEKLAHDLSIEDKVEFRGYVENKKIKDYLLKFDVFALPSIADSFGIVFLEAMACGLPIIAARAGGVGEIIKDEYNGILVKPSDLESLKEAIIRLRDNPELRIKYGENSIETAKKYTWDKISEEYFQLYKDIVKQRNHE